MIWIIFFHIIMIEKFDNNFLLMPIIDYLLSLSEWIISKQIIILIIISKNMNLIKSSSALSILFLA